VRSRPGPNSRPRSGLGRYSPSAPGSRPAAGVGKDAHAVAAVARDLGVGWATIMRAAVAEHGTPLVDDPARLDGVAALGLDETSFLKATRRAPTRYVTGLVDLEGGRLLEVVADRTGAAVVGWLHARSRDWLAQVAMVALDPWRG
jgi:transposase